MPSLPPEMIVVLAPFAQLFSDRVWLHAQVLVLGALLAPGKRTVSSCLRVMGLAWGVQLKVKGASAGGIQREARCGKVC